LIFVQHIYDKGKYAGCVKNLLIIFKKLVSFDINAYIADVFGKVAIV